MIPLKPTDNHAHLPYPQFKQSAIPFISLSTRKTEKLFFSIMENYILINAKVCVSFHSSEYIQLQFKLKVTLKVKRYHGLSHTHSPRERERERERERGSQTYIALRAQGCLLRNGGERSECIGDGEREAKRNGERGETGELGLKQRQKN